MRVDITEQHEDTKIPVKLTIDKQTKTVGEFDYVFVPGDLNKGFDKVSWGTKKAERQQHYSYMSYVSMRQNKHFQMLS